MAVNNEDEKIIAKGLKSPGPLLLVKKALDRTNTKRLRIILSDMEAAREITDYLDRLGVQTELDRAGDDLHVVADLTSFRDGT